MTNEEVYAIWAPPSSVWAPWVKPVLFSYLDQRGEHILLPDTVDDFSWAPDPKIGAALVVDLPGIDGIIVGLQLAMRGYRPAPLYNAVPVTAPLVAGQSDTAVAAVDVLPLLAGIYEGASVLAQCNIAADAPPAFLLDANRRGPHHPHVAQFDNRSICFTTDFPSAEFLRAHSVRSATLVTRNVRLPQPDLSHTLRQWQDAGIPIHSKRLDVPGPPAPLDVPRPSMFRLLLQRLLGIVNRNRSAKTGFGTWRDNPEGHGGGG